MIGRGESQRARPLGLVGLGVDKVMRSWRCLNSLSAILVYLGADLMTLSAMYLFIAGLNGSSKDRRTLSYFANWGSAVVGKRK